MIFKTKTIFFWVIPDLLLLFFAIGISSFYWWLTSNTRILDVKELAIITVALFIPLSVSANITGSPNKKRMLIGAGVMLLYFLVPATFAILDFKSTPGSEVPFLGLHIIILLPIIFCCFWITYAIFYFLHRIAKKYIAEQKRKILISVFLLVCFLCFGAVLVIRNGNFYPPHSPTSMAIKAIEANNPELCKAIPLYPEDYCVVWQCYAIMGIRTGEEKYCKIIEQAIPVGFSGTCEERMYEACLDAITIR